MTPLACRVARAAVAQRLPSVRRHLERCAGCAAWLRRLDEVDRALAALAVPRVTEPEGLRHRVRDAVLRELDRTRRPARLGRMLAITGGAAALVLVVLIGWSRRDAFSPPPRSVQLVLPAGSELDRTPLIRIHRASGGSEER
jgi:predicted anti-sigma-YlaC factor YlaD